METRKALLGALFAFLLAVLALMLFVKNGPIQSSDATKDIVISEINSTATLPASLGNLRYVMNGPTSILMYSSTYEALNTNCKDHHILELQLFTEKRADDDFMISGSSYPYAHLILHPQGSCDGDSAAEQRLYEAAQTLKLTQNN